MQTSVDDFTRRAERLLLAGELAEAQRLCREMSKSYPQHPQSHYLLGVVAMQEARPQLAQGHFLQALKCDPNHVDAYYSLAVAAQALGRLQEAVSHVQKGLLRAPQDAELHRLRGELLIALGRAAEGEASLREAARCAKSPASAAEAASGDTADGGALPEQRQQLERCRHLLHTGHDAEAEREARALQMAAPDWAEPHAMLGEALFAQSRLPAAEAAYRTAVMLDDGVAGYQESLGAILTVQCKLNAAEDCYRRALDLAPHSSAAQSALGLVLGRQGHFAAGEAQCREALHRSPEDVSCLLSAGQLASLQGRYAEARDLLERALALQPDEARAHLNLAVLLLKHGDFARGWREYEWRKRLQQPRPHRKPEWDGAPFPDRTLLVVAEQGLGDTIQFARLLPQVKARGGRVLLEVPPALTELLQQLPGCDAVVGPADAPERYAMTYDIEVDLLSLPGLLRIDAANIPPSLLQADPARTRRLRSRLADDPACRVGLVWAGNRFHILDRLRSLACSQLTPLAAIPGIHYYSLQKGEAAAQLGTLPTGMRLIDLAAELEDMADTAAAIANLDLVISVDTSVAHLAGALGKPVWTLLPYDPDWRWLLEREDSPWYPAMRLFRQPRPGDWPSVIEAVRRELAEWVRSAPPRVPILSEPRSAGRDLRQEPDTPALWRRGNLVSGTPSLLEPEAGGVPPAGRDETDAQLDRCTALLNGGQTAEAAALADRILAAQPDLPRARRVQAEAMLAQGRSAEAESSLRALLSHYPDPAVYNLLGIALSVQNRLPEAEKCYRAGLALQPQDAPILSNLGAVLGRLGDFAAGERMCRLALRYDPANAHAYASLGAVADYQGRYEEAALLFERALALQPDYPEAAFSLGVLRLRSGDFARGWAGYERRPALTRGQAAYQMPRWDGAQADARTVLVYAEQGLGDALQFARFLPLVRQRVGHVLVAHQPELTRLLRANLGQGQLLEGFGADDLLPLSAERATPPADARISLGSLPGLYVTSREAIPSRSPYLVAPAAEQQRWRQRLSGAGGYRVGLVWAGNRQYLLDRLRSLALSELAPLLQMPQIRLYSLQKGEAAVQLDALPSGMRPTDLSAELADMADTAAAIANLDLVISVDTSVAHLAGALGRPVWTLLPYSADWRWLSGCADTPWYPTMRLFRQPRPHDWSPVVAEVCRELADTASRCYC